MPPKSKAKIKPKIINPEEPAIIESIEPISQIQERVLNLRESLGADGGWVYVYKWEDKSWGLAERYPLESFDPFVVRDTYGPGKYKARFHDSDLKYLEENGHATFTFVSPPAKKEAHEQDPLQNPAIALLIKSMEAQSAQALEILKATVANPAFSAGRQGPELPQLIDAMSKLQGLSPKDKGNSMLETLTLIEKIKGIFPEREGGGESWSQTLKDVLEFLPALKEAGKNARIQRGGAPMPASEPAALPAPVKKPNVPEHYLPIVEKIVPYMPKFTEAAKRSESASTWGEYLLEVLEGEIMPPLLVAVRKEKWLTRAMPDDNLKDLILDSMIEESKKPETVERICAFWPPLEPYKAWVAEVVSEAAKGLEPVAETEPPEEKAE